jgi:hypothetical protein
VELRDDLAETARDGSCQLTVLAHLLQKAMLVEAAHHKNPILDRRGPFAIAHLVSPLDGRIVEIGVLDGALEFVGEIAGEKHDGRMGVVPFYSRNRVAVAFRPGQKRDHFGLRIAHSPNSTRVAAMCRRDDRYFRPPQQELLAATARRGAATATRSARSAFNLFCRQVAKSRSSRSRGALPGRARLTKTALTEESLPRGTDCV